MTDLEKLTAIFIELDIKFEFEEYETKRYPGDSFLFHNEKITMKGTRGSVDFYFLSGTRVDVIDCWNQFD